MAIIDKPLCIEFEDDGRIYFNSPGKNEWAELAKITELQLEERMTMLVGKVIKIEGFQLGNGTEVTLDMFKALDLPVLFFDELMTKWAQALTKRYAVKVEAEAKNETSP